MAVLEVRVLRESSCLVSRMMPQEKTFHSKETQTFRAHGEKGGCHLCHHKTYRPYPGKA